MLGMRGWNPMGSLKVYKFGLWMRTAEGEGLEIWNHTSSL